MKKCIRCKEKKDLSEYHKYTRGKDGHKSTCKSCRTEENIRDRDITKDRYLIKTYGISLSEYKAMLKKQKNKCYICGIDEKYESRGLFVDHCHESDDIRKLLCTNCNLGLGHFKDNKEFLAKAIQYLEEH